MNIVIIGGGTVGSAVCAQLSRDKKQNITVVDTDIKALNELSARYDVFGVVGNGADVSILRKAGADKAELLIAAASEDEVNILCCAAARKLGAAHTVARVRNPEYSELMRLMKGEMNLSLLINPELSAAREIYRILRFPSAAKVETFCRGRVELVEFPVGKDSPLCGATLNDLRGKWNIRFLVCNVLRDGNMYIPSGNFRLQEGDLIAVTAPDEELGAFFKAAGMKKHSARNVLIAGGGRITYYLLSLLQKSKIRGTVIETDSIRCREMIEQYDGYTVLKDDPTNRDLLSEQGLETVDAFLALTDGDEENAVLSVYARQENCQKVITLISDDSYEDFFRGLGLESLISPKSISASSVLRYVRGMRNSADSEIEALHPVMGGKAEALEFNVRESIPGVTDVALKDLKPRAGVLIACIVHEEKVIIPTGSDRILPGDTVIVVTTGGQMRSIREIVR